MTIAAFPVNRPPPLGGIGRRMGFCIISATWSRSSSVIGFLAWIMIDRNTDLKGKRFAGFDFASIQILQISLPVVADSVAIIRQLIEGPFGDAFRRRRRPPIAASSAPMPAACLSRMNDASRHRTAVSLSKRSKRPTSPDWLERSAEFGPTWPHSRMT